MNKKQLAIILSKLKTFSQPKLILEQYQTDSEIASQILWQAYFNDDIENKIIADLGCGNGVFGIGSLILGAKKVFFLDSNKEAIKLAKSNVKLIGQNLNKKFNALFINKEISEIKGKVDTVIENPPFGTKIKHSDKIFLEKAMEISNTIYSIHKIKTKQFIEKFTSKNNFTIINVIPLNFKLKKTMWFHKKKAYGINVACFIFKKLE